MDFKDRDDYYNDNQKLESDISIDDANFPETKNDISIKYMKKIEEKDDEDNSHIRKGHKRGKGTSNNNDFDRRNNNNYRNNNNISERENYRRRGGFRGYRGNRYRGMRGRGGYIKKEREDEEYNNENYVYEQEEGKSFSNEISNSSQTRRGKGRKRGKTSYNNSIRDDYEKESKQFSGKGQSNYENDDDEDEKNEEDNKEDITDDQCSMLKDEKRGKGVVRGKRGGRGKKIRKRKEENSDSDTDSNKNSLNSSMVKDKKNNIYNSGINEESD